MPNHSHSFLPSRMSVTTHVTQSSRHRIYIDPHHNLTHSATLYQASQTMVVQVHPQHYEHRHFLVVAYPVQSHINPALQLSKTLTGLGVRVTFSTAISAHRRMFPDAPPSSPVDDPSDPLLSFHPFSDGYDHGFDKTKHNVKDFMSSFRSVGSSTLHAVAVAHDRPPVTCIIHALLLPWVVDVASRLGVPSVLYWIQPAALFAVYHHYFYGHRHLLTSQDDDPGRLLELPGLPPLRRRDLPSFFGDQKGTDAATNELVVALFSDVFESLTNGGGEEKAKVLVNTFDSLETDAIEAMRGSVELIPIGPMVPSACLGRPVKDETRSTKGIVTDPEECMEWLDRWPERSVVYLSFGSISVLGRKQREEFARALVECGRPFLWVAREERDGAEEAEGSGLGKVVGWCSQVEVLSHRAVGCFVTHHGWNSTLEALCCGVPMVGLPQWSDQPMNAKLVEGSWGVGVRAEVDGDGVVGGGELKRCVEAVMGDGEGAVEIRRRAEMWKEKAREAADGGGSSDRNLKAFVDRLGVAGCKAL